MDNIARTCQVGVVTGVPSVAPQIPPLVRDDDVWDMQLAVIVVNPNVQTVTQANIFDTRTDNDVCGFFDLIRGFDTRGFHAQLTAIVNEALEFWANERLTWEQKQSAWQQVQEDFMEAWRQAQLAWTQEQKEIFERVYREMFDYLYALQSQSFTLINNDFDATWNKPGCRLEFDPTTLTSTWIVEENDFVLATRVFDPTTLTSTITFNGWERTIGGNTFISVGRTWQERFDPQTLTTRVVGGV